MTKALGKAIMARSRLQNIYLKTQNSKKKWIFRNLNIKDLTKNKKFCKTIKPYFSDNGLETKNIILKEKKELITDSSTLNNLSNNYFISIASTLKLKQSPPNFHTMLTYWSIIKFTWVLKK